MVGMDSWHGYKREDVQSYYHDAFDAFEIARERLRNDNFKSRELFPSVTYSQDEAQRTQLSIIKTYKGLRIANSDFISQGGKIYLSEHAFAEKIGVDYSIIQKSIAEKNAAPQGRPNSKLQVIFSIITLLIILSVLVFL